MVSRVNEAIRRHSIRLKFFSSIFRIASRSLIFFYVNDFHNIIQASHFKLNVEVNMVLSKVIIKVKVKVKISFGIV